jgi:hypothetical protein
LRHFFNFFGAFQYIDIFMFTCIAFIFGSLLEMAFIAYQDKRMAVRALRLQCRRGSVLGGMASLGSMLFFGGGGGDKKQPSSEKEANDVADAELVERCLITAAQPENLDPEQQDDEASEGIFIK